MSQSRKTLAIVWFVGAGISFLVFLLIDLKGNPAHTQHLWSWYIPAVTPNLSLIVGVMFADLKYNTDCSDEIDSFYYRVALWLSVVYLLVLLAIPLMQPYFDGAIDTYLKRSQNAMSFLQALATTALGAFYVRQKDRP
jgi:hypothetical protein